jgi:hypothetical protein
MNAIARINRTWLTISCNSPLVTEAVLKKGDALKMNERKPKCTKLRDREILNKKNSVNLNLLGSLHSSTGLQIYLNFVNSNWLFCKIRPYSILLRFSYFAFQINITGYAINKFFKNGQLDHFCIFCNIIRILVIILVININLTLIFAKWPFSSDTDGLKYPGKDWNLESELYSFSSDECFLNQRPQEKSLMTCWNSLYLV